MTAREFPTADVLSVTTGILVTNRMPPIAAVYDLCGYVLGDTLWTHQLPAAATETAKHLTAQHPWLADLTPPEPGADNLTALLLWRNQVEAEHGRTLTITPADDPDWTRGNALSDLVDQFGADRIVGVVLPENGHEA